MAVGARSDHRAGVFASCARLQEDGGSTELEAQEPCCGAPRAARRVCSSHVAVDSVVRNLALIGCRCSRGSAGLCTDHRVGRASPGMLPPCTPAGPAPEGPGAAASPTLVVGAGETRAASAGRLSATWRGRPCASFLPLGGLQAHSCPILRPRLGADALVPEAFLDYSDS